jgi:glycosyltransferase involved in cell wall biosynthesis
MRVILVCDFGSVTGGAARVAISEARALAERGVDVVFACALAPVSSELDHPRIRVRCLGADHIWAIGSRWRAAIHGIWNAAAGHWLHALLRECRDNATLVHFHQWTKAFSPSVLAAGTASGLPVVVTLHDYFLRCPNGAYFVYPRQQPCQLQPLSARCWAADCDSRSRAHKAVRLVRQLATNAAVAGGHPLNLIHVSERAATVAHPLLARAARQWVLPNPIEIPSGDRVPAERNRAIVYLGRITPEKGCVLLAQAAALAGVPLLAMGAGPALEAMRTANPDMEVRPWGDQAAVAGCLAQARALALPSLWYETGGMVTQEALARGVPAVVTTTSGAAEILGDDRGLLVPPGDVQALAAALHRLNDDALVRRLSENAYRFMGTGPHQPAVHAERLLDIYRTLLTDRREAVA